MAHSCPDCGLTCHCCGDIDDLLLNVESDVAICKHCTPEDRYDYGCLYPEKCCMPGPHQRNECHTAETMDDFYKELDGSK